MYLENGDEEEYATNQLVVGMSYFFRGFITKVWKGVNFSSENYRQLNKIVIRHCVQYYKLCWDNRNEALHNESMQRQHAIQWYEKIKRYVESNKPRQV